MDLVSWKGFIIMLLKDKLTEAGDFCFRHRTLQYIPYLVVIIAGINLINRYDVSFSYELGCFLVVMTGIFARIYTIGYASDNTSGRNRKEQIADSLNTAGMYSIVRNPLYLGNFLILLGIIMLSGCYQIIIANSLLMIIFYCLIILKEEDFLVSKFGSVYTNWADKTNCIIPSLKNYIKPANVFSLKKVIYNEHDTWMSTLICFIGLIILKGFMQTGKIFLSNFWIYISITAVIIWAVCKFLKKSNLLNRSIKNIILYDNLN